MTSLTQEPLSDQERRRREMVATQLRHRGIVDERVLRAMSEVPRELFVPEAKQPQAYEDHPLPIGGGQTISQPYTVAFMCQALQVQETDKVLEIGTGSGYGAAVLGCLADQVVTVERLPDLAETARERLRRLRIPNVRVITGDGTLGYPEEAPFDAIIVTAGASVIPIGDDPHRQQMRRYVKRWGQLTMEELGDFLFVPLIGAEGWDENVADA
jgi:protein-L-isoaspartate(D-aspartate) O-methyltransferase